MLVQGPDISFAAGIQLLQRSQLVSCNCQALESWLNIPFKKRFCRILHINSCVASVAHTQFHISRGGEWRNSSASESRSEGWAFESLAALISWLQAGICQRMKSSDRYTCTLRESTMIKYVHAWGKDGVKEMHTPGVEPRSQAWEACMMPLHYTRRGESRV